MSRRAAEKKTHKVKKCFAFGKAVEDSSCV